MRSYTHVVDPNLKYQVIIAAARSAQQRILPRVRVSDAPEPQVVADVALQLVRLFRDGRMSTAVSMATDVPALRSSLGDGGIDLDMLFGILQTSLDASVTREIVALERSEALDLHKASKRRRLRLRMEPYRPSRRRVSLDAIYSDDGAILSDPRQIGDAIKEAWAPVFTAAPIADEHMECFLQFIPEGAGRTQWAWPRGTLRDIASKMPPSAPGLDGLPRRRSSWS